MDAAAEHPDSLPSEVPTALSQALLALAEAPTIVLASDFDGTLAPFREDPMAVRPAPGAMEALRRAAELPGVTVALVSGRDADTLALLSGVAVGEPIVLIGSHGAQTRMPPSPGGHGASPAGEDLTPEQRERLDELDAALQEVQARHSTARIERKPAAVALHTRGLPDAEAAPALAEASRLGDAAGIHLTRGKSVVELSVLDATKGAALRQLAARVGAEATFYAGDDVTDETAFSALDVDGGDVTIKVGDGGTAAGYRLPDVPQVVAALRLLVGHRERLKAR